MARRALAENMYRSQSQSMRFHQHPARLNQLPSQRQLAFELELQPATRPKPETRTNSSQIETETQQRTGPSWPQSGSVSRRQPIHVCLSRLGLSVRVGVPRLATRSELGPNKLDLLLRLAAD